jgi:ABC-type transporter Mla subunit MlaD
VRYWAIMLILATVLVGCELTEPTAWQFHARLDDAGGLREGSGVYVAGVRIGRIRTVRLEGDKARIDFTVDENAGVVVHQTACLSVEWYGSGEAHLALRPGNANWPVLPSGSEIECVESIATRMDELLKGYIAILDAVRSAQGTIGRLLYDKELADKVERFFDAGSSR